MKSCHLLLGVVPLGLVACSLAYPTDALSERFSDRPMDGGMDAFDGVADDGNKPPARLCEELPVVASNVKQGRALAVYGSNVYWIATVDTDVAALFRLEWNTKAILRLNPINFDQRSNNPAEKGFLFDTLAVGPNLDQAAPGIAFTWTGSQSLYMDDSAKTDQRVYKCQLPATPRYLAAVGNEIYAALDPDPGNPQVLQVDLKVGKKTDADASCAVLQTRRSPSDLSGQWQGFAVHAMSNVSPTWIYQVGIREGRPGIFRWVFGTLGTNSEALYWPEGGPPGEGAPPRFQGIALAKGFLYFVEDAQRVRRLRLPPEGAGPSADEPQMVYESGAPFKASAIAVVPESNSHSVVWSEQGNETIRALRCPNP